jgi:hypothetical protein
LSDVMEFLRQSLIEWPRACILFIHFFPL